MGTKLKLILFVSLALNLLLAGVFLGYYAKGCKRQRPPLRPPPEWVQKLPPEKAKLVSEAMESLHERNRKDHRKIRQVRREVVEILTAPTFDAKAYQAKMNELHQLHGQMKEQLTLTVMDLASQLNQQERQSLATILERGPRGGRPGGPHPRRRGPGPDHFRRRGPPRRHMDGGGPPPRHMDDRGPPPHDGDHPGPPPDEDQL